MRKRSKYRPRGVIQNPLGYVLESMTPVAKMDKYFVELKIKNHMALANLTKGIATRQDIESLIQSVNMLEALYRLGFGREYFAEVRAGLDAVHAVGVRGAESGRFILKSEEMNALNVAMELHDAQLEVITLKDMENAIKLVVEELRQKKMRSIVKQKEIA
jgi:hypothetical protein